MWFGNVIKVFVTSFKIAYAQLQVFSKMPLVDVKSRCVYGQLDIVSSLPYYTYCWL
jgi:hypothetical protein